MIFEVFDRNLYGAFCRLVLDLLTIFILHDKGDIAKNCVVLRVPNLRLCLIHGLEIRRIHLIIFDFGYMQAGLIRYRIYILKGSRHLDTRSDVSVNELPVFLELLLVLFLRNLRLGRKLRLFLEELGRLRLFDFDRRTCAFVNAYTAGADH